MVMSGSVASGKTCSDEVATGFVLVCALPFCMTNRLASKLPTAKTRGRMGVVNVGNNIRGSLKKIKIQGVNRSRAQRVYCKRINYKYNDNYQKRHGNFSSSHENRSFFA